MAEVNVPRPVATLGLPPLCLGSREYDGYSVSFSRLPAYGQVDSCVAGMGVEPRFRGLMARTVLLVYTLFELLGSEVSIVSASAAPCAAFATVVGQNGSDEEFVDAFASATSQAYCFFAFAGSGQFVKEPVDGFIVWFLSIWSCHMGLFSVSNPR